MRASRIHMTCLLFALGPLVAEEPGLVRRQPVPGAVPQQEAEALIRDFFKADYADPQPDGRAALARRLIAEARATNTDMDLKFVLLREAREAALEAGHIELAMQAVDHTGRAFECDSLREKIGLLSGLAGSAKSPEVAGVIGDAVLALLDQCVMGGQHECVPELMRLAGTIAGKTGDAKFQAKVRAATEECQSLLSAFKVLAQDPADAAANLTIGRFFCFDKGNWERGLPMLARSGDEQLRELARAEAGAPAEPEARIELANGWRHVSKDLEGDRRFVVWEHAIVWYQKALPGLDEDDREEATERVADFFQTAKKRGYVPSQVTPPSPAPPSPAPTAGPAPKEGVAGFTVLKCTLGRATRQVMSAFRATGTWTENDQLWWTGGKPGAQLELRLTAPKSGRYVLKAILTHSVDYGIVQFLVDDAKLGEPHDCYSPKVTNTPWIALGAVSLDEGPHVFAVKIVGSNPKSAPRHFFGIDELRLEPAE